jgi:FkbM family methyltransferase
MLVSYAQNFEDVILWRALGTVEKGFYVDIGAQDPVVESVSLAFYEKGWRGVHVEPIPSYAEKLRASRPDEEVIEAAIASTRGRLTIRDFPDTGLSTGRNEIAERHGASGLTSRPIEARTIRLSDVLEKYSGKEIHWLKIDVEGMEAEAIASWEPSPARPWVLIVESTVPRSQEPDHFEWEPAILAMDYEFVYFDGLNRFYVHQAHAELRNAFGTGPNVFDEFILSDSTPYASYFREQIAGMESRLRENEAQWANEIDRLTEAHRAEIAQMESAREAAAKESIRIISGLGARIADRDAQLTEKTNALENTTARMAESDRYIAAVHASASWRITAPLRAISRGARAVIRGPRSTARNFLHHSFLWLRRRPRALALARRTVAFLPPLERRALTFARARSDSLPQVEEGWMLEPTTEALEAWQALLRPPASGKG